VAGNALGLVVAVSGNTVVVGEDCLRIGDNPHCDTRHQGVVYVYQKPKYGWGNMVQTAERGLHLVLFQDSNLRKELGLRARFSTHF